MWQTILLVLVLFPWSIVVAATTAALYRRRLKQRLGEVLGRSQLHPHQYIPPPARPGPVLLNSAQISKALRGARQ